MHYAEFIRMTLLFTVARNMLTCADVKHFTGLHVKQPSEEHKPHVAACPPAVVVYGPLQAGREMNLLPPVIKSCETIAHAVGPRRFGLLSRL